MSQRLVFETPIVGSHFFHTIYYQADITGLFLQYFFTWLFKQMKWSSKRVHVSEVRGQYL
jgi:hypothetical protein